ncbi:MAG: HEAT repeat domain-containing protein, partial [Verrucomicrobiota bacterium]
RTRGMYYPQGSYGKKSWGKHGPLTNPYAFGYFQHMAHEGDDRRFAQAFCIYEGGLFPETWNGKIIAANSLHNIVWVSKLLPDGSAYRTVDEEPLVETDDRWFRPVFAGVGPDGCVYLADWYDTRLSHVRPVDDWHKNSGRIYRIKPIGTDPRVPSMDMVGASAKVLMEQMDEPNWFIRKRALLESGWRSETPGETITREFVRMLSEDNRLTEAELWKIREYGNVTSPGVPLEPSLIFRAQLAASAKTRGPASMLQIVRMLLKFDEDLTDPHIPLLIWWAIEAHAESARDEIVAFANRSQTWNSKLYREFIAERLARRYAMAGGEENLLSAASLLQNAPDEDARRCLMRGVQLAFQGTNLPDLPEPLQAEMDRFARESGESDLILRLRQGDAPAFEEGLKALASSATDPVERVELARLLGESGNDAAVPVLLRLLGLDQENPLKRVALQSLSRFDDPKIAEAIIARHGSTLPAEHGVRSTAHRVLASRVEWAGPFLEKVELAHIKARDIEPDVVQLLARHGDREIDQKIAKLWPDQIRQSSQASIAEMDRIREIVRGGVGKPEMGAVHFRARCASCHQLFGEGAEVGPDLTGYERHNLEFWLTGIVDPSLELREEYVNYVASMKDGRILVGLVQEQSPATVTLRDMAGHD